MVVGEVKRDGRFLMGASSYLWTPLPLSLTSRLSLSHAIQFHTQRTKLVMGVSFFNLSSLVFYIIVLEQL